jgi:hypothetical protein
MLDDLAETVLLRSSEAAWRGIGSRPGSGEEEGGSHSDDPEGIGDERSAPRTRRSIGNSPPSRECFGSARRRVRLRPYVDMLQEANARKGFFEPDQFEAVLAHLPEALKPVFTVA